MYYTSTSYQNVNAVAAYSNIALSNDGNYVAYTILSGSQNNVYIFDVKLDTTITVSCPAFNPQPAICFSPDNKVLYVGKTGGLNVFKLVGSTWTYSTEILTPEGNVSIYSVAAAADGIDIAWCQANNVFKIYNTLTNTYYTHSISPPDVAAPFVVASSPPKSALNSFTFTRNYSSGVNQTAIVRTIKRSNGTYTYANASVPTILDHTTSSDGTLLLLSGANGTAGRKSVFLDVNADTAAGTPANIPDTGYNRVVPLTDNVYMAVASTNVNTGRVYAFMYKSDSGGVTDASYYLYNFTTQFTFVGNIRAANGVLVNFLSGRTTFEVVKYADVGASANVEVESLTTNGVFPRLFKHQDFQYSADKKRYFGINGQSGYYKAGYVTNGQPVPNLYSGVGVFLTSLPTAYRNGMSQDGSAVVVGHINGFTYLRMSKNTGFVNVLNKVTTSSLNSKIISISPNAKMVAIPAQAGENLLYSLDDTSATVISSIPPVQRTYLGTAWVSDTEFLAFNFGLIDFYRFNGGTLTLAGSYSMTETSLISNLMMSEDRTKFVVTYDSDTPRIFSFTNPSDFTVVSSLKVPTPSGISYASQRSVGFSPDNTKLFYQNGTSGYYIFNVATGAVLMSGTFGSDYSLPPIWETNNKIRVIYTDDKLAHREFIVGQNSLIECTNVSSVPAVSAARTTINTIISPDASAIVKTGFDSVNMTTGVNYNEIVKRIPNYENYDAPTGLGLASPSFKSICSVFSPDSNTLATLSADRRAVHIYTRPNNSADFALAQTITNANWASNSTVFYSAFGDFSPTGEFFAFAYGRQLFLFRKEANGVYTDISQTLNVAGTTLIFAKFNRDGSSLIVGGGADASGAGLTSENALLFRKSGNNYVQNSTIFSGGLYSVDFNTSNTMIVMNTVTTTTIRNVNANGTIGSVLYTFPSSFTGTQVYIKSLWYSDSLLISLDNNSVPYVTEFNGSTANSFHRPNKISPYISGSSPARYSTLSLSKTKTNEDYFIISTYQSSPNNSQGANSETRSLDLVNYFYKIKDTSMNASGNTLINRIETSIESETDTVSTATIVLNPITSSGLLKKVFPVSGNVVIGSITTTGQIDAPMGITGDTKLNRVTSDGEIGVEIDTNVRVLLNPVQTDVRVTFELDADIETTINPISTDGFLSLIRGISFRNCFDTPVRQNIAGTLCFSATIKPRLTKTLLDHRYCVSTPLNNRNGSSRADCGYIIKFEQDNYKTFRFCSVTEVRSNVAEAYINGSYSFINNSATTYLEDNCKLAEVFIFNPDSETKCWSIPQTEPVEIKMVRYDVLRCFITGFRITSPVGDRNCGAITAIDEAEMNYSKLENSLACNSTEQPEQLFIGNYTCQTFLKYTVLKYTSARFCYIEGFVRNSVGTKLCGHYALVRDVIPFSYGRLYRRRPSFLQNISTGRMNVNIR